MLPVATATMLALRDGPGEGVIGGVGTAGAAVDCCCCSCAGSATPLDRGSCISVDEAKRQRRRESGAADWRRPLRLLARSRKGLERVRFSGRSPLCCNGGTVRGGGTSRGMGLARFAAQRVGASSRGGSIARRERRSVDAPQRPAHKTLSDGFEQEGRGDEG